MEEWPTVYTSILTEELNELRAKLASYEKVVKAARKFTIAGLSIHNQANVNLFDELEASVRELDGVE